MFVYKGKSIYGGIAIGKIRILQKDLPPVKRKKVDSPKDELVRFSNAKKKAYSQLESLYKKALTEVGKDNAAIFEIHQIMLNDADYNESIENFILNQSLNAEYAVTATGENFSQMFSLMDDAYMKARSLDVKDISDRLVNILSGYSNTFADEESPSILIAEDLTPSQTVQLDKSKILAFVTKKGSSNSHTSILARTMNIPAIIGIDTEKIKDNENKIAIADGFTGTLYIDPNEETLKKMERLKSEEDEKRSLLQTLKGKENITIDGKKIKLYANIGNINDMALALENDAEGIGLFRSEFIYLEKDTLPTEEEQFEIYKTIAQTMADKPVIIRTLDIGADKQAKYFNLEPEENPAMGLRAIRLCLTRPEIFKTQLRALFRASVFGSLSVMYPMISSLWEIDKIKEIAAEVSYELTKEQIPHKIPEQGIMIETPAAVMLSDKLAKEVSFFSIGTNDLLQYTMAIDRQNPSLDDFFDPQCEAVLKMIELTVKNAHDANIWVGICGELGSDTSLTKKFISIGIDELSVSPSKVLQVRKTIRNINLNE